MLVAGVAADPTPYWICVDSEGRKAARDRPCSPTETTTLTNHTSDTAPPARQKRPLPRPASAPPHRSADLATTAATGTAKGLLALIPLGAFAIVGMIGLALLRRKTKTRPKRRSLAPLSPREPAIGAEPDDIPYEPGIYRIDRAITPPTEWSRQLIRDLEWKRFEELVKAFWIAKGYRAELTSPGADGGVDVMVYGPGTDRLFAVAQCKSRKNEQVGVAMVRELWGVVHHFRSPLGLFYALAGFTPDAVAFAQNKHLKLITGDELFDQIKALTEEQQLALLNEVCRDDYLSPTCPRCDIKMVVREGLEGRFWGCTNYPRCHHTFRMAVRAGY
jgi:hypothetical protein